MAIKGNAVELHKAIIRDKRDRIALVRDIAIELNMDADLIAEIQEHHNIQEIKLKELEG